ncbi:MAG: hypothetical protein U5L11_12665 [Arhodomonas sp.]|nr:hypothetical protein [Arhodomonas sp.]
MGCGLCGEVAHAAALCPSFYRAEIITNPSRRDRFLWSRLHSADHRFHPAPSRAPAVILQLVSVDGARP